MMLLNMFAVLKTTIAMLKKENGGKYHVLYCFEFHHFIHSHLVNNQKGKRHECQICLCVYMSLAICKH